MDPGRFSFPAWVTNQIFRGKQATVTFAVRPAVGLDTHGVTVAFVRLVKRGEPMQGKNGHGNGREPTVTVVKRRCPRCQEVQELRITETVSGWELWRFKCGYRKRYKVR